MHRGALVTDCCSQTLLGSRNYLRWTPLCLRDSSISIAAKRERRLAILIGLLPSKQPKPKYLRNQTYEQSRQEAAAVHSMFSMIENQCKWRSFSDRSKSMWSVQTNPESVAKLPSAQELVREMQL